MHDGDFARIKQMAFSLTGINLSDHKKNMVYSRLARRLRKLHIENFSLYCDKIENDEEIAIKIGRKNSDWTEVISGISEEDIIVKSKM